MRKEAIMKKSTLWGALVVAIVLFAAIQASAATLHVDKWGEDSTTCGAAKNPCLSISRPSPTPPPTVSSGWAPDYMAISTAMAM